MNAIATASASYVAPVTIELESNVPVESYPNHDVDRLDRREVRTCRLCGHHAMISEYATNKYSIDSQYRVFCPYCAMTSHWHGTAKQAVEEWNGFDSSSPYLVDFDTEDYELEESADDFDDCDEGWESEDDDEDSLTIPAETKTISVAKDVHSLPNLDGYDSIIWRSYPVQSEESACEWREWSEALIA